MADGPVHDRRGSTLSTSELVGQAAAQISTLVRSELALAQLELAAKAKRIGVGSGLFTGAGVLAAYGLGLAVALAVVALDLVWPLWLAVLVVMVLVFAVAAVVALIGTRQLRAAAPLIPHDAVASVTADVNAVKTAVRDGRMPDDQASPPATGLAARQSSAVMR
jgi:hypothetical protein